MSVALAIVKRFLQNLIRTKSRLITMFVLPIVFTFMFGVAPNMAGSGLPISVVDQDNTVVSRAVIQQLKHDSDFQVTVIDASQEKQVLRDMKAVGVVTLPKGLQNQAVQGAPLDIQVLAAPSAGGRSGDNINTTQELANRFDSFATAGGVAVMNAKQSGVHDPLALATAFVGGLAHTGDIQTPVKTVSKVIDSNGHETKALPSAEGTVIGFATMFIMFAVFGSTGSILKERKEGTWDRIKTSAATRSSVLSGYAIAFFLTGWIQFLVMYLSGRYLFGVQIPMNLWMAVVVSLYILAVAGIALCIAGFVKSQEQHMAIGGFVAIATCMLGGAYWPTDIEPGWMQHVAWFVPQDWAIAAFKLIALGTAAAGTLALPLVVLVGFTLVFFTAGIIQMRYS